MTMTDAPNRGEFSLGDLLSTLWGGRGIIAALVILATLGAIVYVAVGYLTAIRPVSYYVSLRSIENSRYPNGTEFSPQDLLIPEVLAEIRQRFSPPAGDLRNAITVSYDSPAAAGISRAYRDRLAARNLTQTEIGVINASYQEELRAVVRSSLLITVDYRALGVDSATGIAIARALPEAWTKVFTTQFRILLDTRIADLSITRSEEDLLSAASTLEANVRLETIRQGLAIMVADNRLSLLRTPDGLSASDIEAQLRRFETIYFGPIRAATFAADQDPVAQAYIVDLRLTIADLRRRVAAYDRTLAELRGYQRSTSPPPTDGLDQSRSGAGAEASALELGETSLTGIVQLAERASFAGFVQETMRQRNALEFDISRRTRELELATARVSTATSDDYREQAAANLRDLTAHYAALMQSAQTQLQERSATLYEPALGPTIDNRLVSARSLLTVGAAGAAGLLLGCLVVFALSLIRRRPASQPA